MAAKNAKDAKRIGTGPTKSEALFANYAFFAAKSFVSFGCQLRYHSRAFAAGFLQ